MKPWIGVDFDGTLARNDTHDFPEAGDPIMPMVERVRRWLVDGAYDVKIVTARAALVHDPDRPYIDPHAMLEPVRRFCVEQFGRELEITCSKDFRMVQLWDDRAIRVIPNLGMTVGEWGELLGLRHKVEGWSLNFPNAGSVYVEFGSDDED